MKTTARRTTTTRKPDRRTRPGGDLLLRQMLTAYQLCEDEGMEWSEEESDLGTLFIIRAVRFAKSRLAECEC